MKSLLRVEPLLLALLIFGPALGAYLLYASGYGSRLPKMENVERTLLQPPVALPPLPVEAGDGSRLASAWENQKWSLVYVRTAPCDESCFNDLVRLLQVHLSLGSDYRRVQRVYLSSGDASRVAEEKTILVGRLDQGHGPDLLKRLQNAGQLPGAQGRVYVVDPNGLAVVAYPPSPDQKGLRSDLKRLMNGA